MNWLLLTGLPPALGARLALAVVIPPVLGTVAWWWARRRPVGLATRLATRTVLTVGVGFGLLALVATVAVLSVGLEEVRQRYAPEVVELARTIGGGTREAWSVDVPVRQQLALFRARAPEAGFAVAWLDACATCVATAADVADEPALREWFHRHPPVGDGRLRTVTVAGDPYVVLSSAVRSADGLPIGNLVVGVDARRVTGRAADTAAILVVCAYLLLLAAWWMTRRLIAASVASRVQRLITQVDAADAGRAPPARAPAEAVDELGALTASLHAHVSASVERLRAADRRAEQARGAAARMEATATLAGGVAHDFNNLMMGVMANAQLLKPDVANNPDAAESVATIADCAERGGKLAQQLLAFAHGGRYQPSVLELNGLIVDTLRLETRAIPDRIAVAVDLLPDLHNVEADATQLAQVLSNFVRNAVEAMGDDGELTVSTHNADLPADAAGELGLTPGKYVLLRVADTGPGMDATVAARVFEPFFTTKRRGRGLGLAAAYGIVTHHGGHIAVESSPGGGTTFTVYLPATTATVERRSPMTLRVPPGAGTVLMVDDEERVLTATRKLLERNGFNVFVARNGREAVDFARTHDGPIDVAVLDLKMPVMNGVEAFPLLMAARPGLKVIIASGYDLDASARALLDQGAAAFVSKPFRIELLVREIQEALAARQPS